MADNPTPLHFQPVVTDAVLAQAIRDEITPLLEQICTICTKARKDGLTVGFNLGFDEYGRQRITSLNITKPL